MTTEWRCIPGFSRYSVSDDGRVRRDVRLHHSPPGPVKVSPHRCVKNGAGYMRASLTSDEGKYCGVRVHKLVALAFIGPCQAGNVVRHRDGDWRNNRRQNLRYGTPTDNVRDSIEHGTQVRGSRQGLSRLSEMEVRRFKLGVVSGCTNVAGLAREFGIGKRTAHDIVTGRTWQHVEPTGDLRAHVRTASARVASC